MFKAFTAGLFGILLSTTLGAFAASQAMDMNAPAEELDTTHMAYHFD